MSLFQAFILGLVQGVGEFLPISSSGHLVILPWFFGWQDPGMAYSVFLHVGTLVAVFIYFFSDWTALARAGLQSILERRIGFDRERLLFWYLIVSTIPAVLAGLFLHDLAETAFRSPVVVAVSLAVVGFLLYWIDGKSPALKEMDELKLSSAFWIGVSQALAIIPGVSRAGATITMARLLGFRRETAARYSFLMSFPIVLGAAVFEIKSMSSSMWQELGVGYTVVGFVTSFVFGISSIHFLLYWVRNADFQVFAWYRIGLALLILGWMLSGG